MGVLPTIGSKELVAWLPTLLGVGPGDVVAIPSVCYPTYEVGVQLAGATVVRADSLTALGPDNRVKLIWINSPSNPTGRVLPVEHLRKVVAWARERGVTVVSDECYLALGWDAHAGLGPLRRGLRRRLHRPARRALALQAVQPGRLPGRLRRPATRELVAELLAVRKHAGMIVPAPVQAAMVAALGDETHVGEQRARYSARRDAAASRPCSAPASRIEHSEAGLYLWATRGEDCWATVEWLAERGILAAPGAFYGPAGASTSGSP